MDTQIVRLSPEQFRDRLPEALGVYVAAMDYTPQVMRSRAPAWAEHSRRHGWSCRVALGPPPRRRLLPSGHRPLLGLCYGYSSAPGQWWFDQVASGLENASDAADGTPPGLVPDYVELTELHVAPQAQGAGIGRRLLHRFLEDRTERRVLLSTPEVDGEDSAAWRLYRSEGFVDVLRSFHFDGDPRPFAVLGRPLPLG